MSNLLTSLRKGWLRASAADMRLAGSRVSRRSMRSRGISGILLQVVRGREGKLKPISAHNILAHTKHTHKHTNTHTHTMYIHICTHMHTHTSAHTSTHTFMHTKFKHTTHCIHTFKCIHHACIHTCSTYR